MQIIYLDRLFLLNLLADYLLLLAAGRISLAVLRRGRILAGAMLGAVYGVLAVLPGFELLSLPAFKLLCATAMVLIAYGGERRIFRCLLSFFAVSAALGGALWALGGGEAPGLAPAALLPGFALCCGLFTLLFRSRSRLAEKPLVPVRLRFLGRECRFTALVDTGNSLTDPVSGERVLIAAAAALSPLFGETGELLALPPVELVERSARLPQLRGRLRLLRYSALGGQGLLPVFRPEALEIDGAPVTDRLVAIDRRNFEGEFEGIV